jgi:uncharacterized membrane protein YfcA
MIAELSILFYILLVAVAFLYASVGHGGASGYLALMAVFNMAPEVMKPTALMLNIFVSLIAFSQFYSARHFKWKIFLPLSITSVPMSFLGGLIIVDGNLYKKILAILLLIPVVRFIGFNKTDNRNLKNHSFGLALIIGAIIGLLSGMIGIGGGIILSPVLLLLKWTNQKEAAAISALFIFVNSVSGLAGQLSNGVDFNRDMYIYVMLALAGGVAGSWFGARKFKQDVLKKILALVLLIAIIKLLSV